MCNVDGDLRKLGFLLVWQHVPTINAAPVDYEGFHGPQVVAANDFAADGFRYCPDLIDVSWVQLIQNMKAARLDKRERKQAVRVAQCKLERDSTTIGMADEMERSTIGANVLNGSRLLRKM